ncbi:MAG: phosphopyruvate hydratase [bacterium]
MRIKKIEAHEILDSRGNPTIECFVRLEDGRGVWASVPSGASVGKAEALELRDGDTDRFGGKGVLKAIEHIEMVIAPELVKKEPDLLKTDKLLCELDGTANKSKLGANATLAVSMAVARAQAHACNKHLFQSLRETFKVQDFVMPGCMFNVLNGGMHADNGITFQEFMIMPAGQESIADAVCVASEIYHTLKKVLHHAKLATTVGDEGGFAPMLPGKALEKERAALNFLMQAIKQAGFSVGGDVVLCLDVAASSFYDAKKDGYVIDSKLVSRQMLVDFYASLLNEFPLYSIEDGMGEDDESGWQLLTETLGQKVQLVGDDVFVTNKTRIRNGIENGIANSVLIKPNQIGTVTEAYAALKIAQDAGYLTVVSHRSGETEDSFIADFTVGCAAGQIKAGAPARGERVVKYNRLMEIERLIG